MKKEDRVITYSEARELKWFCRNVVGIRKDFYETMEMANRFNDRLIRLEKTCELIEKFLDEKIEPFEKVNWDKVGGKSE